MELRGAARVSHAGELEVIMSKRKSRNESVPANQPKYEGRNNRKRRPSIAKKNSARRP
jgi:hypothetical protein